MEPNLRGFRGLAIGNPHLVRLLRQEVGQHPVSPFAWQVLAPFLGNGAGNDEEAHLFARWAVLYALHGRHALGFHPGEVLSPLPEGIKIVLLLSGDGVELALNLEPALPQVKGPLDYDLLWEGMRAWHREEVRAEWARRMWKRSGG